MLKKIVIFAFTILLVIALVSCNSYNQNKEDDVLEYLSNKYNQSFTVVSVGESNKDDIIIEYKVSSVEYPEIIFSAGQEKSESNIFPFLPPVKEKVYFDNYFEKSKEYIAEKHKTELIISSFAEVEICSVQIFEMMNEINKELSGRGFDVTKYTPSILLELTINGTLKEIDFYVMDETVIYDLIANAYEK